VKRFATFLLPAAVAFATGCVRDTGVPTSTALYVYATFANPNVTVKVNGQPLGSLSRQYTGGDDCPSLSHVVTDGTMLHFTVQLGQTYEIAWNYGNGQSDADDLAVTSDVVASPCIFEAIVAPSTPATARR
jgi:hypothetical protein